MDLGFQIELDADQKRRILELAFTINNTLQELPCIAGVNNVLRLVLVFLSHTWWLAKR
jgi:hypothetical protein